MATYSLPTYDSSNYQNNRPQYKDALVDTILEYHLKNPEATTDLAVDVATGTGIFARQLQRGFKRVVGVDISETMLQSARKASAQSSIDFVQSPAESLLFLEDSSVDVITVATGAHWFNIEGFIAEAKRVLKPAGTLAIFGYTGFAHFVDYPQCDKMLKEFGLGDSKLGPYWDQGRDVLVEGYRDYHRALTRSKWVDVIRRIYPNTIQGEPSTELPPVVAMVSDVTNNPTSQYYKTASDLELRNFYAAKASINTNFSIPTIPPTIPKVYEGSVARFGKDTAELAVSHFQGVIQSFFVGLIGAKRILEIGTFTGTSAIYFASALKRNGVKGNPDENGNKPVICLDISEEFAEIARDNFKEAGVEDYIDIIVGDAHESLASLEGQQFDVIFIDADKISYTAYFDAAIEKKLLAKGGLFIIDNTALRPAIQLIDCPAPLPKDKMPEEGMCDDFGAYHYFGRPIHEFNEYIRQDKRCEVVMLPIFTGVTLIRMLENN
ncbi:trans-aconitate methyltransferase 1 [Coemansia linderi]|uniref:Trans-aconitate methyltransferase 1 n=1 Tax=Coemansia linderi TaxID=2663919 RepID=A0ACC1KBA7_9FUNG|nr:trans-aconitate methyltransferase 1 [Coemansia linderi]